MIRLLTNWKFTYTIAFAMVVAMVSIRIADPLPLQIMRNKTFDLFQQIKPRVEPEEGYPIGVRIIDLDDESLEEISQWPWPRTIVAELVRKLVDEYGVAAVAFDVVFAEPATSVTEESFHRYFGGSSLPTCFFLSFSSCPAIPESSVSSRLRNPP